MQFVYPIYVILPLFESKNTNSVRKLHLLQKIALQIIFFHSQNFHASALFKNYKTPKSFDQTALENCIFIGKSLKGFLTSVFGSWFKFSSEAHSHDTGWANLGYLQISFYQTTETKSYRRYSVIINIMYVWNHLQNCYLYHILSVENK